MVRPNNTNVKKEQKINKIKSKEQRKEGRKKEEKKDSDKMSSI